jgi:hypothetical protein
LGALLVVTAEWGDHLARTTRLGLGRPPLHSGWDPRVSVATMAAALVAVAVVVVAPTLARRLPWSALLPAAAMGTAAWMILLETTDGPGALTDALDGRHDYLAAVPAVGNPITFLSTFAGRVTSGTLPVHVAGHPPGFVLVLWLLARAGLGGGAPAATLCIAAGGAATALVVATVREVAGETLARDAAPFVAFAPAAVWFGTSGDVLIAFVAAAVVWAFARSLSPSRPRADRTAVAAGLCFGAALMLSYGMLLLAVIPALLAWHARAIRPLAIAGVAAGGVLVAFAALGFWWPGGLLATRVAYWNGIASTRPWSYFVLANLVAFALCVGPASVAALAWLRDRRLGLLVGGALIAVALADLSAMSKGEVERIWLPFALWVLPAGAVFASRRGWARSMLGVQVASALALQMLVRTG